MRNLYVMRVYRESEDLVEELEPFRVLIGDHLTKKDLRIAIDAAFRNAAESCENSHMIVSIFKNDLDGIYFKNCYNPKLVCVIRSDTRVDGTTIDAYVSLERPGSEPQRIRCMNIAS